MILFLAESNVTVCVSETVGVALCHDCGGTSFSWELGRLGDAGAGLAFLDFILAPMCMLDRRSNRAIVLGLVVREDMRVVARYLMLGHRERSLGKLTDFRRYLFISFETFISCLGHFGRSRLVL